MKGKLNHVVPAVEVSDTTGDAIKNNSWYKKLFLLKTNGFKS